MRKQCFITGSILSFVLLLYGCFNIDENSKEYKDAYEKNKKELESSSSNQEDMSTSEKPGIDLSKIYGKWLLVYSKNTETGELTKENPDYSKPDEYTKNGYATYYDVSGYKRYDKFTITNDTIIYLENNKKKYYTILNLNQNTMKLAVADKSISFMQSIYERAPDDSYQEINTENIFGTWVQSKFINKSTNAVIEGAVTWTDSQDAVTIYNKDNSYSIGSIKNNSVAGKFTISNNTLIMTANDGSPLYYKIFKLTNNEFVYSPTNNPNLIFFNSKK